MSDKKLPSEELEEFLEERNCFASYYVDAVRALERENHILNVRLAAVQKQVAASEANVARLEGELARVASWLLSFKRLLEPGDE